MTAGTDDSGGMLLAVAEQHQDQLGPWACIESVPSFNMLGSHVQSDGGYVAEVAHRLRSAGGAWARGKNPTEGAVRPRREGLIEGEVWLASKGAPAVRLSALPRRGKKKGGGLLWFLL